MNNIANDAWPWMAAAAGAIATYAWRGIGVALSGRIRTSDPIFEWISYVAYALLAALVARMIVQPIGLLSEAPLFMRLSATLIGVAAFFITRHNGLVGIAAGTIAMVLWLWQW